ncbi:MAG: transmembrane anchor protein, partial [Bauldia litoralis]
MYNSEKPSQEDLPSSAQLLRSTALALVAAVAILVAVVLPAEYAIDPTGIGRVLGLTEMGEIKGDLAREAERDRQADKPSDGRSGAIDGFLGLFLGTAHAQQAWTDETTFTLTPGEGIEWKLTMKEGAVAEYRWFAEGGRVNFDLHGDGGGKSVSYEKGRGQTGDEG